MNGINFWAIISVVVQCGISVGGGDCSNDEDCGKNQFCLIDSCQCQRGYVQYLDKCLQVKTYGRRCKHDIQCSEHGMICTSEELDSREKMFCFCDPYHIYNSTLNHCLEIANISQMVGNFREAHDVAGVLEKTAQKVFFGVVVAGLISVSVILSFIGIYSVYGCCTKRKKGRYGEKDLRKSQINEVAVIGLPEGSYEAIETDFSAMSI